MIAPGLSGPDSDRRVAVHQKAYCRRSPARFELFDAARFVRVWFRDEASTPTPASQGQRGHAAIHSGFLRRRRRHPSANYGERRDGAAGHDRPALHGHAGCRGRAEKALHRRYRGLRPLCRAGGRPRDPVRAGNARAWHAGVASWGGETDINSASIGIEIVNGGHDWGYPDFPRRQIAAVIALCKGIMIRKEIQPHRVIGHSDVAPGRKRTRARNFRGIAGQFRRRPSGCCRRRSWRRASRWAQGDGSAGVQEKLRTYGYGIAVNGQYDAPTRDVVAAFQRHFRPARIDGSPILDAVDAGRAAGQNPGFNGQPHHSLDLTRRNTPSLRRQSAGRPLPHRPKGRGGGKSGLHGQTVPDNVRRGFARKRNPQGKCHRERTALRSQAKVRVKRCGKSAPRRQQWRRHGKPHREQDRIGTAAGSFAQDDNPQAMSGSPSG